MAVLPTLCEADLFDEAGYLRLHPGIRAAVANGQFVSGRVHFDRHGRSEGRRPNDVDPAFYLRTYPQVTEAFGPLLPGSCAVHYVAYGRGRGYLPRARADRAIVPPGLWTDASDALDRIEAGEAARALTDRQAAMLRSWWTDGLLALDRLVPQSRLEPAALDLERIFAGLCPDTVFEYPSLGPELRPWQPELAPLPAVALDMHFVSAPVRSVILGDPSREFIRILLQGSAFLAASRGFIRPPMIGAQCTSMRFGCGVPGRFVTVWIALEDVELSVWKGSHRLGPIEVPKLRPVQDRAQEQSKAPEPGRPAIGAAHAQGDAEARREALDTAIATTLRQEGRLATLLQLERGTVVLLHPDLFHVCASIAPLDSARAIMAELCPEALMPLYGEHGPTSLYRHGPDRFASGLFRDIEPLI